MPFLFLAMAGLLAAIGGVLPGLALLLLLGPAGLLCVLNARAGRRGGHSVHLVVRDGATQVEFVKENLTFTGEDSPVATLCQVPGHTRPVRRHARRS